MRRLLASAAILPIACAALADQARYRVTLNGSPIGVAYLEQKIGPDGGKSVSVRMEMRVGGQATTVRQQSFFAASGEPVRTFQEVMLGKSRRSVLTTYDADGAKLVFESHGERKLSEAPLGRNQPRAQKAEFWFVRDQPAKGAHYKVFQLAAGASQWELTEVTYLGDRRIRFESASRTVTATYDVHGLPVKVLDSGGTTLVRVDAPIGQVR